MNRRHFLYLSTSALGVSILGCSDDSEAWSNVDGPKVVVSFAPLYSITANVLGERGQLKTILSNSGPHGGDIKLSEAKALRGADLFFINGLGLDNQPANKLILAAANKNLKLVDLGSKIPEKELLDGECDHDHGDHDHDHDHGVDPHVWLGLDHAMTFTRAIGEACATVDPAQKEAFTQRAEAYCGKLSALKAEGIDMLKEKQERKFLPLHGSMQYFAQTFGLEMIEPIQTIPGKEPTPKKLEEIIATCKKKNVRIIAVEPQFSSQSSAKRIADELTRRGFADAVLIEIDPLETARLEDLNASWYEERMRANLKEFAKALR